MLTPGALNCMAKGQRTRRRRHMHQKHNLQSLTYGLLRQASPTASDVRAALVMYKNWFLWRFSTQLWLPSPHFRSASFNPCRHMFYSLCLFMPKLRWYLHVSRFVYLWLCHLCDVVRSATRLARNSVAVLFLFAIGSVCSLSYFERFFDRFVFICTWICVQSNHIPKWPPLCTIDV